MKPIVKIALGFITGAATGSIGTYFALRKKFAAEVQKEVDEYRDIARARIRQADEYVNSKLNEKEAEEYNTRCENDPEFVDYTSYYSDMNVKKAVKEATEAVSRYAEDKDFDKHMAERENPEDDEEEEDSYEEAINDARIKSMEDAKQSGEKPYLIDASEFHNTNQWYDKISITWYMGDDFVCDDQDDIMTEQEIDVCLGGYDWKQWFDKDSNDPDICHVRNRSRGTDYEICRTPERYSDVYSEGISPEEPVIHIS